MTDNRDYDLSGKRPRSRRLKGNKFVTKSGKTIKVHRTIVEKSKARKEAKAIRKAERMRGLPKSRLKRILFRMHPKRVIKFWFSRDGLVTGLKIAGIGIVVGFLSLVGLFAYFRKDLPNLRDISGDNIGGSIRYYDKTGQTLLWEDYGAVKRVPVADENISQYVKDATVAIEDRDFFNHSGFNVKGITRAAWNNAFGGSTQGGSTITQQLVKLTTPGFSTERTVTRKVKELIIAVELERSYSKKEILAGYLNAAPYGGIEYGVETASQTYFKKSAKDLSLDEAAFLASIPKSPPTYSPYNPYFEREELEARQDYVLDIMYEIGKIKLEERDAAKATDTLAKVHPKEGTKYTGITAPYFVLAAKAQLENDFNELTYQRGGWEVTTTLDLGLQKIAEEEVTKGIRQVERQRGNTAAFVAEDVKTGQVVAMVGGGDFNNKERAGEVNFAQRPLPPGSSFKPYDYLSLIEHTENAGAGAVIFDTQGPIEGYSCTNKARPKQNGNCLWDYDFRYPGPVTLRYALGGSRNVPAVKAMLAVGVNKTIETADKLGLYDEKSKTGGYKCYEPGDTTFTKETQCYGSSAIGDGAFLHLDKHVHAFSTISRNGLKIPQTYILKVKDSDGKIVTEWKPSAGEQVVRPDAAYIVADIMSDPRASYMSRKSHDYKGHKFSLKTGTTNDNKDGWLMGFSTQYAAGVWVGHHSSQVVMSGFMETMTQPIWGGWMQRAHDNLKPEARVRPSGVQTLAAYVVRNHVGVSSIEPSPSTDLFPSWYKKPGSIKTEKKQLDKVSSKLATECTPTLAIEESTDSEAVSFSADPFYNSKTNTQDKDDIHKCEDIKPLVDLSVADNGNGTYLLTAIVTQGTHAISSDKFKGNLSFKVDGGVLPDSSFEIAGPGVYTYTYTSAYNELKTLSVDIIDSVLYSGSDAEDIELKLP